MRSVRLTIVVAVALFIPVHAKATCCECRDPLTKLTFTAYTPTGLGKCAATCGTSRGEYTGKSTPGGCPAGPLPALIDIVVYSIGHQGAAVMNGDSVVTGEVLRERLAGTQRDWEHGQKPSYDAIMAAPIATLEDATRQAIPKCQSNHVTLNRDLHWVWDDKGQKWNMWDAAASNNVRAIRDTYHAYQRHNAQVKNMLACYTDAQILGVVRSWGDPGARPKRDADKPGRGIDKH